MKSILPNDPITQYSQQNRGNSEQYRQYYDGMNKTAATKRALALAHLYANPGSIIADMGMGSGETTFQQAFLNPHTRVIGVDISETSVQHARDTYTQMPNLSFRIGDIEQVIFGEGERLDGILNSSALHHVHSFNGYDAEHVKNAIKNQALQLREGGIIVIRDFIQPQSGNGIIRFTGADEALLFEQFAREARSLEPNDKDRGFFYEKLGENQFRASWHDINEFILRKDYTNHWEVELQEEYGYFTREDFLRSFRENELRVNYAGPVWNPWIVRNRFAPSFSLTTESGVEQSHLPTNFVIVGEKVPPNTPIWTGEKSMRLSDGKNKSPFLTQITYREKNSNKLWDVVSRPSVVHDTFPHYVEDGRIHILIRYAYPRPIINTNPRGSPNIDQKAYSGFMIEPIVISTTRAAQDTMQQSVSGIISSSMPIEGLRYYASPGMLAESVDSSYPVIQKPETTEPSMRVLDIQDIIKAAQAGGLPDVRIEIGAYRLLQQNNMMPDPWIGDSLTVANRADIVPISFNALWGGNDVSDVVFEEVSGESANFLDIKHSVFAQYLPTSTSKMTIGEESELDFVVPKNFSTNTLSVMPILKQANGEILIYIERRSLPVPQIFEGSSKIITNYAYRLDRDIDSFLKLENYVRQIYDIPAGSYIDRLGEGFYTSMGVTPEKVYPMLVSHQDMRVDPDGSWVTLKELFQNIEQLRDMQLISSIYRLIHALGKWEEYSKK